MKHALYMETEGRGPELVLLHGWGLHGGIWDTLLPRLTPHLRVTRVDLPGHGHSKRLPMPASLPELAALLLEAAPPEAVWLGWSLGGLVALQAALQAPQRLHALVLANSTPRFVTGPGWNDAMPPQRLQEFAAGLGEDYRETLLRFLSLQVRGDETARTALRQLRSSLFERGEPDTASLATGLALLRESDLRAKLKEVAVPTLLMAGIYDRLTPPGATEAMAHAIAGARLEVFPKSAHAPFISHPEAFTAALLDFVRSLPATTYRDVQVSREAGPLRKERRERP